MAHGVKRSKRGTGSFRLGRGVKKRETQPQRPIASEYSWMKPNDDLPITRSGGCYMGRYLIQSITRTYVYKMYTVCTCQMGYLSTYILTTCPGGR